MNFIDSGSSQQSTEKQNPNEKPTKHHLRGQDSSFSSGSPLSVNSRQNAAVNQDYVLTECQKLILKGKYSKAFINLRRHLMNAEVEYHLRPQFYSQLVHTSLKLCEKYLSKGLSKSQQKIPLLLQICYSYLEKWEQYLTGFQENSSSSESGSSRSFNSSENGKDHSPNKQQNEDDFIVPSHLQLKARVNNASPKSQQRKNLSPNKLLSKTIQLEGLTPQNQFADPADFQEAFQMQQGIQQTGFERLQNVEDQFHLHRELFLSYLLKTMFISYRFHKLENYPPKALAYLTRGSEIVRNFLCKFLFVSSAELSRIAAKIEVTLGNVHMELGRKQEALTYYKTAYEMSRNGVEVWVKKIGSYNNEKDVPYSAELRCEKQIKEFIAVLYANSICEESLFLYVKAIDTMGLADWVARSFLPSDSPLREQVNFHYQKIKDRYKEELEEESEVQKILRSLYQQKVNLIEMKESEAESKYEKQREGLDKYFYDKANCEELNKNLTVVIRKKVEIQPEETTPVLIRSSFSKGEINGLSKKAKFISKTPVGIEIRDFDEKINSSNNNNLKQQQQFPQTCKASYLNSYSQEHSSSLHDQTTQIGFQSYLSPQVSILGQAQGKGNLLSNNQSFSATTGLQLTADNSTLNSRIRFNSFSQASMVSTKNLELQAILNPSMSVTNRNELQLPSNKSSFAVPMSSPDTQIHQLHQIEPAAKNSLESDEATNHHQGGMIILPPSSPSQSRQQLSFARISTPVSATSSKKHKKIFSQSHILIQSPAEFSRRSSLQQGSYNRMSFSQASANKLKEAQKKKQQQHAKKKKMDINDIFKDDDTDNNNNNNHPKHETDKTKLEQLKLKFRYMRDSQREKDDERIRNDVTYKFMKVPLEERTDLMDLDVCMKKLIETSLAKQSKPSNYPEVYLNIEQTLQKEGLEKKNFKFANDMVSFSRSFGNGHSTASIVIPSRAEDAPTIEIELNNHRQAIQIASLNEQYQQKNEQAQNQLKQIHRSSIQSPIEDGSKTGTPGNNSLVNFSDSTGNKGNKILSNFLGNKSSQRASNPNGNLSKGSRKISISLINSGSSIALFEGQISNMNLQTQKEVKIMGKQNKEQKLSAKNSKQRLSMSLISHPDLQENLDSSLNFSNPSSKNLAYINIKQNVLYNEQERESISKEIYSARFKNKKLSINELIASLAEQDKLNRKQKKTTLNPEEYFVNSLYSQLRITPDHSSPSQQNNQMNESQSLDRKNSQQSPKILLSQKNKNDTSNCSINPKYFCLDQYYRENSELLTNNHIKKQNGQPPFDMERYQDLAASTKNMQQLRLFKQNPFSVQSLSIFNKLKKKEDGGTSKNAGESSNKSKNNKVFSQSAYSLPRRLSLFFERKKE